MIFVPLNKIVIHDAEIKENFYRNSYIVFANNLLLLAQRLVSYSPKLSVSTISKLAQNAKMIIFKFI